MPITPKSKPSYTSPKAATVPTPAVYQTYASTLAQKSHPTLLYRAPSHTTFMISSYGAAGFCFAYAGLSFWSNYLSAPADLAAWVPVAFGGICFMMAGFGGWLLLGPARLVRTITAMPKIPAGAIATNATKTAEAGLEIEIELRKMFPLPFFPARKIYVKPEEVVLPRALAPTEKRLTAQEMRYIRQQEEEEQQRLLEYERSHIMTSPFRHMNKAFYELFKSIGRTWTREGLLKLGVKGQSYKLDVTGGWVLDGGRALDRLATVKPRL